MLDMTPRQALSTMTMAHLNALETLATVSVERLVPSLYIDLRD